MSRPARLVVLTVVAAVAGVFCWSASNVPAQEKGPPKPSDPPVPVTVRVEDAGPARWEYKVIDPAEGGLNRAAMEKTLNDLGGQGWEVAGSTVTFAGAVNNITPHPSVILKRRR